jgi:acetyl esterase/lipase
MKIILFILVIKFSFLIILADPPVPFAKINSPMPGHLAFVYEVQIGTEKVKMPFGLFLPNGYEEDKNRKWPMIVFLHGGGEIGTDLNGVYVHGISREAFNNPKMLKTFPFIICLPQSNIGQDAQYPGYYSGWDHIYCQAMISLSKALPNYYRIDTDRITLTGLSMGGNGTWAGLDAAPDLWAAAVPFSGRAWKDPDDLAKRLRYSPIWTIGGLVDAPHFVDGAKKMHKALMNAGNDSQLTLIPNVGHFAWLLHYNNPEFFQWLLRQTRPKAEMISQAEIFRKLENDENALCAKSASQVPGRIDNKGLVPGFDAQWFKDIDLKTPLIRRLEKDINYTDGYKLTDNLKENISLRATGWVKIEKAGRYSFITTADDGSRLTIGTETIIDDWVPHGVIDQVGNISLKPGFYKISIEYFQGGGPGSISIFWVTPDSPRSLLTEADIFCEPFPR